MPHCFLNFLQPLPVAVIYIPDIHLDIFIRKMKWSTRHLNIQLEQFLIYLLYSYLLLRVVSCFDNLKVFPTVYVSQSNSLVANGFGREIHLRPTLQVSSYGILELFSEKYQNYIPLCYPGLSLKAAHMICHHMGFTTSLDTHYITNDLFINGLHFYIDCNGYEESFDDCWIANRSLEQEICPYLVGIKCSACIHEVRIPSGMISSPGFPLFYPQTVECEWTIYIPKHYELFLKIDTFDLPHYKANQSCINGYLEIGFMINKGKHLLARYCGQQILNPFISASSVTWIRFYSGWTLGNHYPLGFNLTFESRKKDYGTVTANQILLATLLGIFLLMILMTCIFCYWKRACRTTKDRHFASRKENVVRLVEQYVNDTTQ